MRAHAWKGLAPSRAHPQYKCSVNLVIVHCCSEFIILLQARLPGGGVRGRGLPLPPAIDAPKHKHGSHVFPPSAAKHARRCSAPPRPTSGLAQPWLSVCPRGRSCLKMFQSENMYARRCGCDSIVNARRDTNGTTATACLNAETHVGPGANRGEAAGV